MSKRRIFKLVLTLSLAGMFFLCLNLMADYWFEQKLLNSSQGVKAQADIPQSRERLCLVFALDGVPYDVIRQLQAEGYFNGFFPSGRLVSTFPSLSRPAFSRILLGGKPYGYERLYFDDNSNQIQGTQLLQKVFGTKKRYKDYAPKLHFIGFPGYIAYVFPEQFTDTTLEVFKNRLKSFTGSEFIAYMGISDSIAHVEGRAKLIAFLKQVSNLLDEIREELDQPMNVVLFSDHGNNLVENEWVDLARTLKEKGYRDSKTLQGPKDFVLLRNGFVSAASMHTHEDIAPEVATLIATVEGVDFSVYRADEGVIVNGSSGVARIERIGNQYRYQPIDGDPLGLLPVLKENGYPTGTTMPYLQDDIWWNITRNHFYPDPLQRIWLSLHGLVQHPPTILISAKEGHAFGPMVFNGAFLQRYGTHGALLASHSNGFLMTDFMPVEPVNRPGVVAQLLQRTEATKRQARKQARADTSSK